MFELWKGNAVPSFICLFYFLDVLAYLKVLIDLSVLCYHQKATTTARDLSPHNKVGLMRSFFCFKFIYFGLNG